MAGNWKMCKTPSDTSAFFKEFNPLVADVTEREIVIFPPFVNLTAAIESVNGSRVEIGGQNMYWAKEGAFTGEISGPMLKAVGCRWVLVAHSERRQYFGETEETALQRIRAALETGLTPVVCVGEHLQDREAGKTHAVLEGQFQGGIAPLEPAQFAKIVIAYEPVWAIGTGRTATPQTAADSHRLIREMASIRYGRQAAADLRILYGGSVKPDNAKVLMAEEEIDGVLVGGASLDPQSFATIVKS